MLYDDWETASLFARDVNSKEFIAKKYAAVEDVLVGRAAFERDSVVFDKPTIHWPFLASLMRCIALKNEAITIVDFGGGFGSLCLQHSSVLEGFQVRWNIIELEGIVELGKQLDIPNTKFYHDINEMSGEKVPDLVIFSGVLQYLSEPYSIINQITDLGVRWIIVDRTPFWYHNMDRVALQRVPTEITDAIYPYWIFAKEKFLTHLMDDYHYKIIFEFPGFDLPVVPDEEYIGFLFEKKQI